MKKKHILLIENNENEVEFFTDALEEAQLNFLCSTARNTEQAIRILKNIVPDIIFFDIRMAEDNNFLVKLKNFQEVPLVIYSTIINHPTKEKLKQENSNWLQLPGCVRTMASILQNLLLN